MTLRLKLLLFLIPLVAGPLLGLGWIAYDRLRANAETTALAQMNTLVDQVALNVETLRRTAEANVKLFAGSNLLKTFLFAPEDERVNFVLLPLMDLFASYHDAYPDYVEIAVLGPEGGEQARYVPEDRPFTLRDDTDSVFFRALAAADGATHSAFALDPATGEPVLRVGRKLVFVDPTFEDNSIVAPSLRGFLVVTVTLDALRRQVAAARIGTAGHILFADATGRRLFPDAHAPDLTRLPPPLMARVRRAADTGAVIGVPDNPPPVRVEARRLGPNLFLAALLPEAELVAAGNALGLVVAVFVLGAIIVAVALLLAVLQALVVRPLRRLGEGAAAIGAGDLSVRLPAAGRDELARLARQFNAMAADLDRAQQEKDRAQDEALANKQLAIDNLRKADRLKDEFLANTSHELRTPLHGMIGLAEGLRDGAAGRPTPAMADNLGLIVAAGQRLAALVNDILDFSRLKHRDLQLNLRPVDLAAATDLVFQLVGNLAAPKGLALTNRVPADLPAVLADENRLQQILHNLIGNALKFTDQGGITVEAARQGDRITVTVADTGIGIPPDRREAIFASFEQVDGGAGRAHGGTGLGLAVTRSLVQAHGGEITVTDNPGGGSRFIFALPVADAAPAPAPAAVAAVAETVVAPEDLSAPAPTDADPDHPDPEGGGALVLVVDDEPVNLQVISNHLTLRDYRVHTATGAAEALAWLNGPDGAETAVVLLDVMMPRRNGFDVCAELRRSRDAADLPVIFLTARNQERDIVRGFAVGGNDYVPKPFSRAELLARVALHVDLARRNRELRELTTSLEAQVAERTEALSAAYEEMKRLARLDGLTQVHNRRHLDETLEAEWQRLRRHQRPLSLLMIDVDAFKAFNDSHGHQQGDQCLVRVAGTLRAQARHNGDLVARYGGEEFCMLVEADGDEATGMAERVRQAVRDLDIPHGNSPVAAMVTVSIGVATLIPTDGLAPTALFDRADAALYQAKAGGRNRVVRATDG